MIRKLSIFLLCALCSFTAGCGPRAGTNKPLMIFQKELLDLAFEAAADIPIKPHIKSRSRVQEQIVGACLELGQPELAKEYIPQIKNWRRGTAHADLGFYYARNGAVEKAREQFEIAEEIALVIDGWQKGRIRAHAARGYAYLGQKEQAARLTQNSLKGVESGKVNRAAAMVCDDTAYDEQVKALKKVLENRRFDVRQQALIAATELFNTFYEQEDKRIFLEEMIWESWGNLSPSMQIDLLAGMAEYALAHNDSAKAGELLEDAGARFEKAHWKPEFRIPIMARLAWLWFHAGNNEKAKEMTTSAEAVYDDIANIYRVEALCLIAGAYQKMGQTEEALRIYARAFEENIENPNSRTRAEGLALICRSMALRAVEPTPELWARIRQINAELGNPW
ncbi:MAG: hypothetical protein U9R52_01990 [Candidatus Omnitrophota bacterium]|nr:hypothetical protein [Candidatus Omnitrophota bacterium]